jgi:RNA polymerase sigma-70 factor (ECF subfamily)
LSSTPVHTDQELFQLIASGDEAAFTTLFHRYVPKLYPVLLSLVRSEAVARDLIQDAFLKIWINRNELTDIVAPNNWIFRIVYNLAYSWLERQALGQKVHQRIGALQPINTIQTEEQVLFAETARLLQQAVHHLPPQTKRIYLLSREQGLKNQEIADALQLSVSTVKNTLVNACKAIKEYLEKKGVHLPMVLIACSVEIIFSLSLVRFSCLSVV